MSENSTDKTSVILRLSERLRRINELIKEVEEIEQETKAMKEFIETCKKTRWISGKKGHA